MEERQRIESNSKSLSESAIKKNNDDNNNNIVIYPTYISRKENSLKLEKIEESFKKALIEQDHSGIHTEYASFLYMNNRAKEALPHLLQAIDLEKDKKDLSYCKIEEVTVDKNLQKEIDYHGEIEIRASILARYLLIINYKEFGLSQGDINQHLLELEGRIEKEPSALGYSILGHCYKAAGHYPEAKDSFKKAIELDPNYHLAGSNYLECSRLQKERSNLSLEMQHTNEAAIIIQRNWRNYIKNRGIKDRDELKNKVLSI